jgi:hypothetical protein
MIIIGTFERGGSPRHIRRQITKPQQAADMRVVELEQLGDVSGVPVSSITKTLHPGLRAGDRQNLPMIDPSRRWLTGNDDFLSCTRLWRRQGRPIHSWSIACCIALVARLARCRGPFGELADDLNFALIDYDALDVLSNERADRSAPGA